MPLTYAKTRRLPPHLKAATWYYACHPNPPPPLVPEQFYACAGRDGWRYGNCQWMYR